MSARTFPVQSPHPEQTDEMDQFTNHLTDLALQTLGNIEDAASCLMTASAFTILQVLPPHLAIAALQEMVAALKERLSN